MYMVKKYDFTWHWFSKDLDLKEISYKKLEKKVRKNWTKKEDLKRIPTGKWFDWLENMIQMN